MQQFTLCHRAYHERLAALATIQPIHALAFTFRTLMCNATPEINNQLWCLVLPCKQHQTWMIVKLIPTWPTPGHIHHGNCTQGQSNWYDDYSHHQVVGIIHALITFNVLLGKVDIMICGVNAVWNNGTIIVHIYIWGQCTHKLQLSSLRSVWTSEPLQLQIPASTLVRSVWQHASYQELCVVIQICFGFTLTAACDWDCLLF